MQTNMISKWAALLLTFSGMAALPLTSTAEPKVVNTATTVYDSNAAYSSVTGTAALDVSGSGAVYSGTNINLSSNVTGAGGRYAIFVTNQGVAAIFGGTVTTPGLEYNRVALSGTSTLTLNDVVFVPGYSGISIAISSTVFAHNLNITATSANGYGLNLTSASSFIADSGLRIVITGSMSDGAAVRALQGSYVNLGTGAYLEATGAGPLTPTNGQGVTTLRISSTSTIEGVNATIISAFGDAVQIEGSSTLTLTNSHLQGKHGVAVAYQNGDISGTNVATLIGGTINAAENAIFVQPHTLGIANGENTIINISGVVINSGTLINNSETWDAGSLTVNLNDSDLTNAGGIIIGNDDNDNNVTNVNVSGGSGIHGDIDSDGNLNLNLDNSSITGGINASENGVINITGSNGSTITGNVNAKDDANVNVDLDDSKLTGNITGSGSSNINISGSNGSSITGDVNGKDDSNVNVNLDDSTLTGDITGSGSSNIIITGSNGSVITGTATGNDNANLDITVSGPGSSWLGDVNQNDDSKITINIDNGATGTGGFNGGDLNVLGPDSSFNFDKDSHVNNGYNDGTLNIGDHQVEFDNLTNNGKIIINVNSDDQSHGKLDVTGTANGDGKINVNVTGSTAVSDDDRDKILNDMFDHNAKDAWQFDPIEWGLEEDDVITNPDGSVYVRPNGKLSTAGSIATGLIAAQKSSWFAQQNSLLKRMGELRLQNSVESVTISGKEDKEVAAPMLSADKLIENVWIRSYGQQLNYGASVTGQAFKQYVYGVDLGTDHKFTLDRNNALFTGIFAGYGAADTDHRHYGSKSEISNYYAGLYASWLNVDGWYLDATLKAQYTDNRLDGYADGVDYFNGNYNNWSIGGSLEFGKQIKFKDDWFVEPQLQANYLHILASDYTMSQGLNVNVSDLDAFQLRFGIVAGKTLKLKNGGALQPYFKISGVEMVSTGGKLSAMGNNVRPNLDGARAELGAGIIWQLDAHNQLHLDYEASFGDKYDKPWGLTAGYRYQF